MIGPQLIQRNLVSFLQDQLFTGGSLLADSWKRCVQAHKKPVVEGPNLNSVEINPIELKYANFLEKK